MWSTEIISICKILCVCIGVRDEGGRHCQMYMKCAIQHSRKVRFITAERCAIVHLRGLGAPMYMKCACAREGGGGGREFQNVLNIVHVHGRGGRG